MLKIHYYKNPDPTQEQLFQDRLGSGFRFSIGKELPFDTEVLILGYPSKEQLEYCHKLKYILIPFAGVPQRTKELLPSYPHIKVLNIHHNAPVVAETVVGFIFALSKHIIKANTLFRGNDWSFRYGENPSFLLKNRSLLLCGYGTIARYVELFLKPFNMKVGKIKRRNINPNNNEYPLSELRSIIGNYDIIVNLLPSTSETKGCFDSTVFQAMKSTAIYINTGRADTAVEEALFEVLTERDIGGAAQDVWYNYPKTAEERTNCPPTNLPFNTLDNFIMSPHRAGGLGMPENEQYRVDEIIKAIERISSGNCTLNEINLTAGY